MPTLHCQCGAKYRFPESAVGKRAKCKKCGVIFTIEPEEDAGPIPLADEGAEDQWSADIDTARGQAESAQPPPVPGAHLPSSETAGRLGPVIVEKADTPKTYAQGLFAALFFATSLHNALTFIVLWVVLSVLSLMLSGGTLGCFFALLRFVFYMAFLGWWAAYRFNVVASGAAGDDDLPALGVPDEGVVALLMVFLQWIGSWLVVLMPAAVFAVIASMQGWLDLDKMSDALDKGVVGVLFSGGGSGAAVFAGLVVVGMFCWPIIILCIALGGFGCIARFDLIVTTIVKTFPVYLFTAVMVFGTDWLRYVLAGSVDTRFSAGEGASMSSWLGSSLLVSFLVMGITAYFEIVAMKLIGLYYHHFKHRFAWSWG